jgi:hypothetical protein
MSYPRMIKTITVGLLLFSPLTAAALTVDHIATDAELLTMLSDTLFVSEGRIGNNALNGDFEVDLGGDTAAPEEIGQYVWPNGTPVDWSLTYDHLTHLVTFTVDAIELQWVSQLEGYTDIFVRTRAVDDGTSITVGDLVLDGETVGDVSAAVGDGLDILWIGEGTLDDGFTMTGTANLSWSGTPPLHSRLAFQIKVGKLAPVATEAVTWSGVKDLYRR